MFRLIRRDHWSIIEGAYRKVGSLCYMMMAMAALISKFAIVYSRVFTKDINLFRQTNVTSSQLVFAKSCIDEARNFLSEQDEVFVLVMMMGSKAFFSIVCFTHR